MKEYILIFAFLTLKTFAFAQTIEYSIYAPEPDSFFLIETVTALPSKDEPRPARSETSQLFRSDEQLLNYVQYLKEQSSLALKEADEAIEEAKSATKSAEEKAKKLREAAPRIEAAALKIEKAFSQSRDISIEGKAGDNPPPKKSKKRKKRL